MYLLCAYHALTSTHNYALTCVLRLAQCVTPSAAGSLQSSAASSQTPVRLEVSLAAGLPGKISRSQRSRRLIPTLLFASKPHEQRSASPSLEALPRRLHALSQSPQQPRWPRYTNLLHSSAQGESWRSFSCFVPTSTSSHLQWKMIGSHEQAHLL